MEATTNSKIRAGKAFGKKPFLDRDRVSPEGFAPTHSKLLHF